MWNVVDTLDVEDRADRLRLWYLRKRHNYNLKFLKMRNVLSKNIKENTSLPLVSPDS